MKNENDDWLRSLVYSAELCETYRKIESKLFEDAIKLLEENLTIMLENNKNAKTNK